MKKIFIALMFLSFIGCNEETKKPIPQNYDQLMLSKINVNDKVFLSFTDLVIEDCENDFLGFVAVKDGKFSWHTYSGKTYLIESKSTPMLKDDKRRNEIMHEYYVARDIFKINEFLYNQDKRQKRK